MALIDDLELAPSAAPEKLNLPPADDVAMWFVWRFNFGREDFEVVGAFTKEEEARALEAAVKAKEGPRGGAHCQFGSWNFVMEQEMRSRLGKLAAVLDRLAPPAAAPAA